MILALVPAYPFVKELRLSTDRIIHSDHRVEILHKFYAAKFEAMLRDQSMTFEEAQSRYQCRYHREPPDRFDKWF
jgi:hypothetical protein